jgi:ADP-heptose:LPS heptosyltransferase
VRPTLLVLRALGLGDFLTAVPALRAIRRARPDHEVVLATPGPLDALVALSGAVDRVHPTTSLEDFSYDARPDIAVNLHGRGPESHRALAACCPRELVAFATGELGLAGPRWRPDEHEVRRWCRLVEEAWSVRAGPADLLLAPPDHPGPPPDTVVVHPGAAYPARRWPPERFAAVARSLDRAGHHVVVTGAADEREVAAHVCELAGLGEDRMLAGCTDLLGLAALVAGARLVVSGDTGVAHLASAYATPSVVLFGPVSPALWGPPAHGPHVALWRGSGDGNPWGEQPDPALLRISAQEVLDECDALLGPAGPGPESICVTRVASGTPGVSLERRRQARDSPPSRTPDRPDHVGTG